MNKIWVTKNLDLSFQQSEKGIDKKIFIGLNLSLEVASLSSIISKENLMVSTLLKTIAGVENKYSGQINNEIKIGYLPENNFVFPWMNVSENITFGRANDKSKVAKIVDFIGLNGYENHYPNMKSFGFLFRIGLGRMLFHDFELILIDNSLKNIQQKSRQKIYELLLKTTKHFGKTILFSTSDIQEAVFLSEDIFVYNSSQKSFNEQRVEFVVARDESLFFDDSFHHQVNKINSLIRKI
ncbi:MAG: hypothetical protein Fur0015_03520 [Ignavibacteriales bacterium]